MSPRTNQVAAMFDNMTEQEQTIIYALMLRLAADDIATAEDIAAHEEATKAWREGKTVPLASVI